ncbi:MAG: S49 family peptidase, partial [Bacteroidota bacterium]
SEVKPIIASFGNVAASGGYYIAAKCDRIFAQPNTITGSIGIFSVLFDAQATMNQKLGLTFDEVETNRSANFANPFYPMSPAEEKLLQSYVERGYGNFLNVVREGRGFPDSLSVDKIAQGRVWSGKAAKGIQLVDEMGDLKAAISYAAEEAGLGSDYMLRLLPKPKSAMEELVESMSESMIEGKVPFKKELQQLEKIKQRIPGSGLYMLMPYDEQID